VAVGKADGAQEVLETVPPTRLVHFPTGAILPGLIDSHAHLTLAGDGRTYEQMTLDRDEMMALVAVRNMHRHLAAGVTTIRDNGGRNLVVFAVREAIERLSGRPITHSLGHFHWCNGVADSAEEIVAAVRRLVAEGADHIKIMASGGGTVGTIPSLASYRPDELRVAVETAHDLGRLTTAHARANV
jgi:imidazolonepropionase-like amidohydrolase